MSKKFTGITSAGSAIPVYDKDAHSALEQKLDTSAFSSVSGDFLTEVPESAVSGFATHEEVESATSGKMDVSGLASGWAPGLWYSRDVYSAYNGIPFYAGDKLDTSAATAVSPNFIQNNNHNMGYAKFSGWNEDAGIDISGAFTRKRIYITDAGITLSGYSSQYDADQNINGHYLHITPENYVDKTTFKNIVTCNNETFVPNDVKTVSGNYDTQWDNYSFIGDFSGNDNLGREFTVTLPVATTSFSYTAARQDWRWLYQGTLTSEDPKTVWKITPNTDYTAKNSEGEFFTATFYTLQITQSPFPWTGGVVSASLASWNDEVFATRPWVEEQLSANVPQGVMQTSGLEYDGDKISGYMGSAFAGGGEVPEGVMVESAVGYNAVNEISGYNGSAIAQYGAEKQWLVHDDTLVHAANSAQYALGVNVSAVQTLMGLDETVLYTGNTGVTAFTASEPFTNFREVAFYISPNTSLPAAKVVIPMVGYNTSAFALTYNSIWAGFKGGIKISTEYNNTGMSSFELISGAWFGWANDKATTGTYYDACIYKIIGIGRKEV